VGWQAHDPQGTEHPNATMNNLVKSVRATGAIGVVGVFVPEDPKSPDKIMRQGQIAFDIGAYFTKGLRIGSGQANVKAYNRRLRDLIAAGKAACTARDRCAGGTLHGGQCRTGGAQARWCSLAWSGVTDAWSSVAAQLASRFSASAEPEPGSAQARSTHRSHPVPCREETHARVHYRIQPHPCLPGAPRRTLRAATDVSTFLPPRNNPDPSR
jgi:hypothetical protein